MPEPGSQHWRFGLRAQFTLLFYAVTLTAIGLVGFYGYNNAADAHREHAEALMRGHVDKAARGINSFLERVRDDARFHTRNSDLLRYTHSHDKGDDVQATKWLAYAADDLRNFNESYPHVQQSRFISTDGRERILIRQNPEDRSVRVLLEGELGERSGTEAFTAAMALRRDELYISPIDRHRALPDLPVVRLATPFDGENGKRYGVLETYVYADPLFQYLRTANRDSASQAYFLLDPVGNYLFHPEPDKMLAHRLLPRTGHPIGFRHDFPGVLEQLSSMAGGTVTTNGYIVTYSRIYPSADNDERYWTLVGVVEERDALAELRSFEWFFLSLMIAVVVLAALVDRYILDRLIQPIIFTNRQIQRLGLGETTAEPHGYKPHNEIRTMLDSTERLQQNLERLADQADAIARGDLSGEIPILSAGDRLGMALNNMITMLRAARDADERRNWLKDGLGQLSQALSDGLSSHEQAQSAINRIAGYLNAGRGVLYRFDPARQELELLAGYMVSGTLPATIALGEGVMGQVAQERRPVILGGDAPEFPVIRSGTGTRPARFTYTYPLLREGQLLGVLEVADFDSYGSTRLAFLERASEITASFLFVIGQQDEIRRLLGVSEKAAQQAREANADLEAQRQQLLQQTEELRQANAQMEEQQQQLGQQSEELQRANAQMEEQHRQMEAQQLELQHKNAALRRSRDEQLQKAEQLELANRYKSEFLANMSHELRTPLNSIILLSKMLGMNEQGRLDPEDARHALIIHQAGEELLRLIDEVLDLAKVEAGRVELQVDELSSDPLLDDLVNLFEVTAREKELEFRVERSWQGRFTSDRNKLSQVLRNLLANAFKFTRAGHVLLRIEHNDEGARPIRFVVEDSGIGIPREKQAIIFEDFQQVDGGDAREFGGTGLGLTISRRYVELLGGTLTVESEVGQGSRFVVALPECPPAPTSAHTSATEPAVPEDDRKRLVPGDTLILLVDDDPAFGRVVLELNHRLGYRTLIAPTGAEGLRLAEQYRPHGILLDLVLPDMEGAELLHRLKSHPELRHIPVHVVSCRDKDDAAIREEIVGYLQKPVNPGQLALAQAEVIREASETGRSVLVLEGIGITAEEVSRMVGSRAHVRRAGSADEALAALRTGDIAVIIIDLQRDEPHCTVCRRLREAAPGVRLLLYATHELSEEESDALKRYTDTVIVNKPRGRQRLLDNIERFLREAPASDGGTPVQRLPTPNPQSSGRLAGRRILVVDDDPRNLFVITAALEQAGATVETAFSGARALSELEHSTPDLVFIDIMMPDLDGHETIRRIRARDTAAPPIVVLSAKALAADRERALAAGASAFVAKPVDYDQLIATAEQWCQPR